MSKKQPTRIPIEPFRWEPNDPLAAEHQLAANLVTETMRTEGQWYRELELEATASGQAILAAGPEGCARVLLALVARAAYHDSLTRRLRSLAESEMERANWHQSPEWENLWPARQICARTVRRLVRRKLPLQREHLLALADWIASGDTLSEYDYPLNSFVKALESFGKIEPADERLHAYLVRLAKALRETYGTDAHKLAQRIEELLALPVSTEATPTEAAPDNAAPVGPDPSIPALAGSPQVLLELKQFLRMLPEVPAGSTELIGFDRFPLRADSPFKEEHELINMFLPEVVGTPAYHDPASAQTPAWRAMLARDAKGKGRLLLAAAERCAYTHFAPAAGGLEDYHVWQSRYAVKGLFTSLLSSKPELDRDGTFDVLLYLTGLSGYEWTGQMGAAELWFRRVEAFAAAAPFTPGERHVLYRFRCQAVRACPFGRPDELVARITRLLGDQAFLALVPGEAWSDAVNAELGALAPALRERWLGLLRHAASATGTRPSAKWLKTARELVNAAGADSFSDALQRWFPLVNAPRTVRLLGGGMTGHADTSGVLHDEHTTCLRGLLWMCPEVVSPGLLRAIGALTVSCYRKIPGVGPRAVKAGNAGVYALSQVDDPLALGQLALLKVKVKFGSAQKEIEKAFNAAAERSGLPREELEEMSIPTYGLTDVGLCEELMGDFTARLSVTGTTTTELVWVKADGKVQRAVPASVKEAHKEDLKELQAAAKDIQKMLPAQRERIDGLFLQQKTWPLELWRERYLNHPLIGTLARRILWEFKHGETSITATWFNGRLMDLDLKPVNLPDEGTTVQLWHPIGKSTEEVLAWRSWLDAQQIQQPFKQAHREIYVLTDAEQNTGTYSNRYAAHVLKQHQFNALCALRGWKNQLRLMVDAEYPPTTLHLPQWGLRAEFWVEGLGTNYGADTNESGVYLYLSTDQVRFYRVDAAQRMAHAGGGGYRPDYGQRDAEPLPLEQIPPLVLSEVMRDVDMFVGVASVGNDPAWSDGGPEGRYRQYWQTYSFGELSASARTRKEVLERLVPKLKIAGRCSFVDRFLVVQGSLRTYKIHLGSGNILMEPNDQYLCIVPRQGDVEEGGVLLPFEGDRTLSIVLSKAFLLADDARIKDETIIRQIRQQ